MVALGNPTPEERRKHKCECWFTALQRVLAEATLLAEAVEGLEGPDAEHQGVRTQDAEDFLDEAKELIERAKGR